MLLVLLSSLVIVGILNLSLGLVIIFASEKRTLRQMLFFIFSVCVFLWAAGLALFLSSSSHALATIWAQLYYLAAAVIGYTLLAFAMTFLPHIHLRFWLWMLLLPLMAIVATIVAPGSLISAITLDAVNGNEVLLGPMPYLAYTIYFLCYMYGALGIVGRQFFRRDIDQATKHQLRYIFIGLMLAGTFGVLFNLILPLYGNYKLIWVGPQFSILLVGFIFAAIVRHGLFDVRVVIARATAYLSLLVTMALVYGLAVFSISSLFFSNQPMSPQQNAVYIALAVFLAFTFQPFKNFFDRITERIFFRRDYNPQDVLVELGNTINEEINLSKIANQSLAILSRALKPEYAIMIVLPKLTSKGDVQHFEIGQAKKLVSELLADGIRSTLIMSTDKIIVTDNLEDSRLKTELQTNGIKLVLRLETSRELVGYLLFGHKQSGTSYKADDARMLATVGDELGLAIQNALRFEEIEHFNETLKKKVADATEQLRETNKKLKELDQVKDEFVSMASHQLRTPLTSIKGYISMVLDGDVGKVPVEQRKFLEAAFESSQRMVYLVGDFLNVSRIQTGKFVIERRPVNLAKLVSQEVEQLRVTAAQHSVTLDYDPPSDIPVLQLDEDKIHQVVLNFIDNAIFYSRANTSIKIHLSANAGSVIFKVIDTGIGVPVADRAKLFSKFFRADNARRTRPDGTGIGLFLAKKVVVAHGGSIIFESEENVGSTFGFTLPVENQINKSTKP